MVQCLNAFSIFLKESKDHLMVQRLKRPFIQSKTYFAKKDKKNNLTKHFVLKELRRSDFLITIEEYVGAWETPSSTTKR